jgi:hypothetical protein
MIRLVLLSMAVISLSGCMTTFELAAEMYKECVLRDGVTSCESIKNAFSSLS